MKIKTLASAILLGAALSTTWARPASADTALELLHGWNYDKDFNGSKQRTILTIKTFQPWSYGSFFMYYDITGPFTPPNDKVLPNEKGGFFGSVSTNFSAKRIAEKIGNKGKKWDWGALVDLSLHVELEHVSKFGSLMYYGAQLDIKIPHFDFASFSAVIRDDWSLAGVAVQLNGAWQITFPIGKITDLVFDGFFSWGLFGEGKGVFSVGPDANGKYTLVPTQGRAFFLSQPQLLVDVGKLSTLVDHTLYVGLEYQIAFNRYLQQGVTENVPQLMFKWAI